MWLTHNWARARSHALRNNTQITRWGIAAALFKISKNASVFFYLKKGGEKKICRLAEGRDGERRRVESMSKQSESRREPGDTEEAQRIWLSLEPWQGILAECAYMCVCLISPAEGVNAVIQNGGICVKTPAKDWLETVFCAQPFSCSQPRKHQDKRRRGKTFAFFPRAENSLCLCV